MPSRTTTTARARRVRPAKAAPRRHRSRRSRARSRSRRLRIAWAIAVPVALIAAFLVGTGYLAQSLDQTFPDYRSHVSVPAVAGYRAEQLQNACTIVTAGRDLGFDERDQTIAVMTAMGESSLRNLDYGDWETSGQTNPDGSRTTSIGLFQQQDSWGSREARLDPYTAAVVFYRAMAERVPDRAGIEPTLVAHRTQVNDDPRHYARFWDRAVRVVAAVSGAPLAGDSVEGIPQCPVA